MGTGVSPWGEDDDDIEIDDGAGAEAGAYTRPLFGFT